jgi:hypothetical protein
VVPKANYFEIDPAVFTGLSQTYVITRSETGYLQTTVVDGVGPRNLDEKLVCVELGSNRDATTFDYESVYLLSWQSPSVTATLTGLSDGFVVGSARVEIKQDPTQVKVDWTAIDTLVITYSGTLGLPVRANFLFL